jgi:predicted adenylyl cyclase CyaB
MANNLEIKAICPDLRKAELIVKDIATQYLGIDNQTDTYFHTKSGRFKLRESSLSGSYLIPYIRSDQSKAKLSLYDKINVTNGEYVKSLFKHLLGIQCVVTKKRIIYLYENVRIHLDDVKNLGSYIEFEAVFDENNDNVINKQKGKINYLMKQVGVNEDMLIASSYENLMKDKLSE